MKLLHRVKGKFNELFVFELRDGYRIEGVLYRGDTLCVSTQVGCPVRCVFCASGRQGLIRNLNAEEIYGQYSLLKGIFPIKRIAMAGIGEPLLNWKSVKEAFLALHKEGLKISFYTSGFPLNLLNELIDLPHNGLTISLHSLDPIIRKRIMPRAGDLYLLISFLREKIPQLNKKRRKKISLAYILLKGINSSEKDLRALAELARSLKVSVTLLSYNSTGGFDPVSGDDYERAFLFLRKKGVKVTLSSRFRRDSIGGCGTLTVGKK